MPGRRHLGQLPWGTGRTGFSNAVGTIQLNAGAATGRAYLSEVAHLRDGGSQLNYFGYHDRYQRTADGWRFIERVAEFRYVDTTPLAGSPPHATEDSSQVRTPGG